MPDVNQALDVHVELLVVLLNVENVFDVVPVVITFVLTVCDVVHFVGALDELFELDVVRFDACLEVLSVEGLLEVVLCNLLYDAL